MQPARLLLLLLVISLPLAGCGGNVSKTLPKSSIVAGDLRSIEWGIEFYLMENGRLPPTLRVLIEEDERGLSILGDDPDKLRDPWGNEYFYAVAGEDYRLWTFGSDGAKGGERDARDIDLESIRNGEF